jgi:hypothetical protein
MMKSVVAWMGLLLQEYCVFSASSIGRNTCNALSFTGSHMSQTAEILTLGCTSLQSTNDDGMPDVSIIHIDCIFRAAHLIPLYGSNFLPRAITLHDSYNVFRASYINKYADYHAFEVA